MVPADADLTLGACMNLGVEAATGDLVAKVDDDNFYGTHYLTDLVRALDYSGADVVGKWAHLVHLESSGATLLRFEKAEHRFVEQVQGGTLLMRRTVAERIRFEDLPRRVDTTFLAKVRAAGLTVYAADRFNFVSVRRADTGSHTWPISDKEHHGPLVPAAVLRRPDLALRRPEMTLLTDRPSPAEPQRRAEKPKGNSRIRRDIEGLRAVATFLVLPYHAGLMLFPGGYVGVDVFFVISGFVITGQLIKEVDRDGHGEPARVLRPAGQAAAPGQRRGPRRDRGR